MRSIAAAINVGSWKWMKRAKKELKIKVMK